MNITNACSCTTCQNMCKTPCLGTPDDILKLIEAGYADRLAPTEWAYGLLVGTHTTTIMMMQPKLASNGYCTFYKDGLCELHDLGLKPTEGRLAHCSTKGTVITREQLHETPLYGVVREWEKIQNML